MFFEPNRTKLVPNRIRVFFSKTKPKLKIPFHTSLVLTSRPTAVHYRRHTARLIRQRQHWLKWSTTSSTLWTRDCCLMIMGLIILFLVSHFNYPPFASIAKGDVFVLLYVCLFVCSSTISRQPAGRFTPYFACGRSLGRDVSSRLLGVGGPRRAEKEANEIFVIMGVNGEFLHFGGF